MVPYYEDDVVTLYHADCRDLLDELIYDVVVMDPPYGTKWYASDQDVLSPALLRRLAAVPTALFGYPERLCRLLGLAGLVPSEWVTWWPTNGGCRGFNLSGLRNESEHVAILGRHRFGELRQARSDASRRMVLADYQRHRLPGGSKEADIQSNGVLDDCRLADVWTDSAPGLAFNFRSRQHPNEKPLPVMHRLVDGMSLPDQVVLDPFAGSGTTLRAAKDLGRRAVGVEIEERWCEVAVRRLAQEVLAL